MINFSECDAIKNMIFERIERGFCIDGIEMEWGKDWFDIYLPMENTGISFNDGFKLIMYFKDSEGNHKNYHGYVENRYSDSEVEDIFIYGADGGLFAEIIAEMSWRLEDKVCKELWKVEV